MGKMRRTKGSSDSGRFVRECALLPEQFFARYLVHVKGEWAGQPLALEKWQTQILRKLFGYIIASTGLRQ